MRTDSEGEEGIGSSSWGEERNRIRYLSIVARPNLSNVEVKGLDSPLHLAIIVTAEEELQGFLS